MKTLLLLCCAVFAVSDAFFITSLSCKPPSSPYHGTYGPRKSSYKFGEKITYYCPSRYFRLRKSLTRTCLFGSFQPKEEAYCDPICPRGYTWMGYYDRDDPSATGDHETLSDLRKKHPKLCARPISIQAKVRGSLADYRTTGQKVEISPTLGLRCLNKNVKGNCKDYIVRFCCDINECDNNPCDTNARCTNFAGSHRCTCNSGYTGNGRTCSDVNECANSPCHEHASCSNSVGSYSCACNTGYSGNGHSCQDIDECEGGGPCGQGAVCTNTDGSHTCSCPNGYTGNPYVQCTRVNCPAPTAPANGLILGRLKNSYNPGDKVYFGCDPHFKHDAPSGTIARYTCQSSGEWTGYKPTCYGTCRFACNTDLPKKVRGSPPCGCNATCEENGNCCKDYVDLCTKCSSSCQDRPTCKCSGFCGFRNNECCSNYEQKCRFVRPTWGPPVSFSIPTRSFPITPFTRFTPPSGGLPTFLPSSYPPPPGKK